MRIWDKIRIKRKIKGICKVLKKLSREEQLECIQKIIYGLHVSDNWKDKECFLDIIIERVGVVCH